MGNGLVLRIYKYLCLKGYSHKISYIFNSHFVYDSYCSNSKRKDIPCVLVYPAINHNIFKIYENNRDNIKKTICLVARKHPLKGLRTFINMYKNLPDKYRMKIASIKLITHDELMGFDITGMDVVRPTCDEDIADVYQNSDIFISTSWQEGFGLPPLEAMACGCAVITSKSGGVNEFAKENENCLMFEPKNELELSEQLIKLLEDENLRKRIAYEGIKTAQKFDWNKSAQQLINVL